LHVRFRCSIFNGYPFNFNQTLTIFNVREQKIENLCDSNSIYSAGRLSGTLDGITHQIRCEYRNTIPSGSFMLNSLKSILSQIKNLFHSISKIVLNHQALTQSVGFSRFCIHKRFGMFGLCIHKINFLRFYRVIANLLCADFLSVSSFCYPS
jgi:hypothetical protein